MIKILVYGTGGVGGYFGGRLAQAGHDVTFMARNESLKAIKENGLIVKSVNGDFTVKPAKATDDISEIESPDLVIFGLKSWQIKDAAKHLKSIITEETMVLPLQNGADNMEKLQEVLPKKNVLAGFCRIYSKKEAPGVINHFQFDPEIIFGELDNEKSERVLKLKEIFNNSGFKGIVPDDIHKAIWKKFSFIATVSGLGGLTRVSIGRMWQDDYLQGILKKTGLEIQAIAQAKGVDFNDEDVVQLFQFIDDQGMTATASTQRDIMAGRPSELGNFNGYIVEQGKKLGIETPVNEFIYRALLPMEKEARRS
ncbi:ketopantoate reductase family protein [Zunongwangia atlantica]|uniref:2-dehydropantoate 2-reductase n=1 Tax=Zunongwangia atlantica 22II14-10F7 TaxID=1185767 RepID=A0A1Y1T4Z3_9FLAO|nr:2-dehydropantoate 2-reductase [Zunongwangia atlantica]ORL46119.1 ketopantoate reductase PanE/ApbA [Zunongwangia atlantica 22II14-10F7]